MDRINRKSGKMIPILYSKLNRMLSEETWSRYLNKMSTEIRQKIIGYRRWEDRQARLFGKLLVLEGLKSLECDSINLNCLSYDKYGRLFIGDHIDFNISHSCEYVICAITNAGRVGVDIERINPIDIFELDRFMTEKEIKEIHKASDPCREFYKYWTIKESVLKADGRGLSGDLKGMTVYPNEAIFQGQNWFLRQINIDTDYSCYLATNVEDVEFQLIEIQFGDEYLL